MLSDALIVVELFALDRRHVAAVLVVPVVVEPVQVIRGRGLDMGGFAPRPLLLDQLGFVEPVDRFSQRVVVSTADSSDRGVDPDFE